MGIEQGVESRLTPYAKEKGSSRWKNVLKWGGGSFIVFAALFNSLGAGALAALIGGGIGYKRASSAA